MRLVQRRTCSQEAISGQGSRICSRSARTEGDVAPSALLVGVGGDVDVLGLARSDSDNRANAIVVANIKRV